MFVAFLGAVAGAFGLYEKVSNYNRGKDSLSRASDLYYDGYLDRRKSLNDALLQQYQQIDNTVSNARDRLRYELESRGISSLAGVGATYNKYLLEEQVKASEQTRQGGIAESKNLDRDFNYFRSNISSKRDELNSNLITGMFTNTLQISGGLAKMEMASFNSQKNNFSAENMQRRALSNNMNYINSASNFGRTMRDVQSDSLRNGATYLSDSIRNFGNLKFGFDDHFLNYVS